MGIPILGIMHDWSKLLPIEFFPQSIEGRGELNTHRDSTGYYRPWFTNDKTNRALHHHMNNNKHHWQYWVMNIEVGDVEYIKIPERYIKEMICDWIGANKVRGNINYMERCRTWYIANGSKIIMHKDSRKSIERYLGI